MKEISYWKDQIISSTTQKLLLKKIPLIFEKSFEGAPDNPADLVFDEKKTEMVENLYNKYFINNETIKKFSDIPKEDSKILLEALRGQLTKRGAWDSKRTGSIICNRYTQNYDLLTKEDLNNYKLQDLIYLRTTQFPRTVLTGQNFLLGFINQLQYNKSIPEDDSNIPFNIVITPRKFETLLGPLIENCPQLYENLDSRKKLLYDYFENKVENDDHLENFKALFPKYTPDFNLKEFDKFIRETFHIETKSVIWTYLHDRVYALLRHNLHSLLPENISLNLADDIIKFNTWRWKFINTKNNSRLAMGRFIKEVVQHFDHQITKEYEDYKTTFPLTITNNSNNSIHQHIWPFHYKKINAFFCHDSSIIPLLNIFQFNVRIWPKYNSVLMIELFEEESTKKHYIRFVFNGKILTFPNHNSNLLEYNDFTSMAKDLIPNVDSNGIITI